jgi:hypothetical protein
MTSLRTALVLVPLATACGATTPPPQGPQTGGAPPPASEAPAFAGSDEAAAEPGGYAYTDDAPRAAMRSGEAEGALAPRDERPGLATHWGEARRSPTTSVAFERSHPARPAGLATFGYDDFGGVRTMTGREPTSEARVFLAGGALTVTLADAQGRALPAAPWRARTVAAGEPGQRYQIRVDNHTPRRFEIVATVDGLDVIDGRDGDLEKRGYLLGPWATIEIDGFRRSEDEVAAFRFGDVGGSYAVGRGRGRDVGVIGVAAFAERGDEDDLLRRVDEARRRQDADPFPGRFAPAPSTLRVRR